MLIAALVVVTLLCLGLAPSLRYVTASRMQRLHAELVSRDDECRRLRDQLSHLREECTRLERLRRQATSRRMWLRDDIESARAELQRLQTPASDRVAA